MFNFKREARALANLAKIVGERDRLRAAAAASDATIDYWIRHNEQISIANDKLGTKNISLRHTAAKIAKSVAETANKLATVNVHRDYGETGTRYRVVIDIDPNMVETGLRHGDDAKLIGYIGDDIGRQAAEAIRQVNFTRPDSSRPQQWVRG